MLFAILLVIVITIFLLAIIVPVKKSYLVILLYFFLGICLLSVIIYQLKTGGFTVTQNKILFGFAPVREFFKSLPLDLSTLSYVYSVARMLFVCVFFLNAAQLNYHTRQFFKKYTFALFIIFLPLFVLLFFNFPPVYERVFSYAYLPQKIFSAVGFVVLCTILTLSAICLLFEYFDIKLSWYKKKFSYLMFGLFLNMIQFLLFAGFDPVHMFQDLSRIRLLPVFKWYPSANYTNLLVSASVGIVGILIAAMQSFQYFYIDYSKDRIEFSIKKEVRNAGIISTGLVHGIKNQLLSSKILSAKIMQTALKPEFKSEDLAMIRENAEKLTEINRTMLERLDYMYKSFKEIKTVLLPVSAQDLFTAVRAKLAKKINTPVILYTIVVCTLLADREMLSEALYNILLNSVEAVENMDQPYVSVTVFLTRIHTIIKITDNGRGIPTSVQKTLFLPFYSSKNTHTNWGLGLCYSRQIIRKHMGDIRFESSSKTGTTFYVTLPKYT